MQVSPFFASVLMQIKLNTLKLQSIHNTFVTKDQEPMSIFAIFLYLKQCRISPSQQHAVCQATQLYSWYLYHILEVVLQFLYPKYYMQQKCSHCTHLKPFSTPWILNGETPMLLRVELSFFFGKNHHPILIHLVNSALIISVMFSFSGGLVDFS